MEIVNRYALVMNPQDGSLLLQGKIVDQHLSDNPYYLVETSDPLVGVTLRVLPIQVLANGSTILFRDASEMAAWIKTHGRPVEVEVAPGLEPMPEDVPEDVPESKLAPANAGARRDN